MSTLAAMQTERQFSDAVVEYARLCGWLVHRDPTWRATGTDPGYPDLTLVSPRGRIVFAELKANRGKVTEAQMEWAKRIQRAQRCEYYEWRPSDWSDIERILR